MNILYKLLIINILLQICFSTLYANKFTFRKYAHVKKFYKLNAEHAIDISKKYKLPPAAILAIAGLESGYGRGYVAQITGNILSLGAFKGDKELPALYLPYSKSKKTILFNPKEIKKHSKNDLSWKRREKSLKRDYRPTPFAGTETNLELLIYNKSVNKKANIACLNDFATRWISDKSRVKRFKEARIWLDALVQKYGVKVLFTKDTNNKFISMIGGHPRSFNYRESWPKKVKLIMRKVGLVKLVNSIEYEKMDFETAWKDI